MLFINKTYPQFLIPHDSDIESKTSINKHLGLGKITKTNSPKKIYSQDGGGGCGMNSDWSILCSKDLSGKSLQSRDEARGCSVSDGDWGSSGRRSGRSSERSSERSSGRSRWDLEANQRPMRFKFRCLGLKVLGTKGSETTNSDNVYASLSNIRIWVFVWSGLNGIHSRLKWILL